MLCNFRLPAEGITIEYLSRPIHSVLLQPLITGALLLACIRSPQRIENILSLWLHGKLGLSTLSSTLKVFVVLGSLYRANNFLNRLSLNNFILRDRSWNWHNEVVLVTGGSSGMGALMVQRFAERGIRTVALDINPPQGPFPANAVFFQVDVTNSSAIREAAARIRDKVGEPTVLINNAGTGCGKPILEETEPELRRTFDVNVLSHFHLVKEFLPYMVQRNHGHVVTVASAASFVTIASNVDYSCSKAGALAFHEGLGQELRHRYKANRVRTTVVHPGWVRTPLIDELLRKPGFNDFVLEPETVVNAIVKQVLKGESAQLILPGRLWWLISSIRGASNWWQDMARSSQAGVLERPEGM